MKRSVDYDGKFILVLLAVAINPLIVVSEHLTSWLFSVFLSEEIKIIDYENYKNYLLDNHHSYLFI